MRIVIFLAVISFVSACGSTIQNYNHVSKETNVIQTTSIGSELYRIKKQKDLINAFGKADIFGGKVDAGYTELRFMGLNQNGDIIFRLTDIDIESNESTMSRYSINTATVQTNTTVNASTYGNTVYGNANSTSTIRQHNKPEARVTQLPANTVEFSFPFDKKKLELESIDVEIISVSEYSIKYTLRKK